MARALSIALAVVLWFGGTAWGDKPRIAVLGLETPPGPGGVVDPGSQVVAKEITKELRQRVQSPACPYEMAPNSSKELLDEKLLMSCENEAVDCMVVIGAGLASDFVLYGRVDKKGDSFRVSLKLLDVKRRTVLPAIDELPVGGAVTGVSRRLYRKLIGDGPSGDGTLIVKVRSDTGGAVRAGSVIVDDQPARQLVAGKLALSGIPDGRHTVAIDAGGYRRYEEIVTVRGGEPSTVDAILHTVAIATPQPPDPKLPAQPRSTGPSSLWKWSLGAGIALAVGGGALAWYSYDRQQAQAPHVGVKIGDERCGDSDATVMSGFAGINLRAFRRACTWHTRIYAGYGVAIAGGALAITSLIMMSRDPGPSESPAARSRGNKSDVAIAPILTPELAGAQLSLSW